MKATWDVGVLDVVTEIAWEIGMVDSFEVEGAATLFVLSLDLKNHSSYCQEDQSGELDGFDRHRGDCRSSTARCACLER